MTDLRDARFRRALEHAPDAQDLPSDATRRSIRAAARAAVTPAPAAPWWRRWWAGDSGQRTPWSAAFASVLLASLVTVLWYDREVPDAAPQAPRMEAPASVPAPPAPSAAPAPPPAKPAPQRKAAHAAREKAAASRIDETHKERRDETPPLAQSAPAPAAAAAPAPAPAMRSQFAAAAWTHLRIEIDGRRVDVLRGQSERLDGLVDGMAAWAGDAHPLESPVQARIVTLRDGQPHGVLELAPPRIRWTAQGRPALTAQPDAAQLQALRDELARLAR